MDMNSMIHRQIDSFQRNGFRKQSEKKPFWRL
jgi:hypothetical protein